LNQNLAVFVGSNYGHLYRVFKLKVDR